MTPLYDWSKFYQGLCQHGPDLLVGIDEDLREAVKEISMTTDMFWSENLEGFLAEGASAGSLQDGALLALDQWRMNVVDKLEVAFGISLEMDQVGINSNSPKIDLLVEAASPG